MPENFPAGRESSFLASPPQKQGYYNTLPKADMQAPLALPDPPRARNRTGPGGAGTISHLEKPFPQL